MHILVEIMAFFDIKEVTSNRWNAFIFMAYTIEIEGVFYIIDVLRVLTIKGAVLRSESGPYTVFFYIIGHSSLI